MEKAVVFGCGKTAYDYREEIHKRFEVIAYTCNQPTKWGLVFDNVNIIDPAIIPEDAAIIVASEAYYTEILFGLAQQKIVKQGRVAPVYVALNGALVRCYQAESPAEEWRYEYPKLEPVPTTLGVSLSGLCNSKCLYCEYHSEYNDKKYFQQSFLNKETLEKLIKQIKPIHTLKMLKLFGSGEPMWHPDWDGYASRLLNAGSF